MGKFRPSGATLHKTKIRAQKEAKALRKIGWRAEVQPSTKTTQKRSPTLKWVCHIGQKKKR